MKDNNHTQFVWYISNIQDILYSTLIYYPHYSRSCDNPDIPQYSDKNVEYLHATRNAQLVYNYYNIAVTIALTLMVRQYNS